MRIALGTWTRDWLSIADMLAVQRLTLAAARSRSLVARIAYIWRVVCILTARRAPWSLLYYPRIVAAYRFRADRTVQPSDIDRIEREVLLMCADIGSRCGKLPREVAEGLSFEEADIFYKQLLIRALERALDAAMGAVPMPDYVKRLADKIRQLQHEIRSTRRTAGTDQTVEPVRIKDMFLRYA